MTKNKHPKLKLARKMMTHSEIREGLSPFGCLAWLKRYHIRKEKELLKSNKEK